MKTVGKSINKGANWVNKRIGGSKSPRYLVILMEECVVALDDQLEEEWRAVGGA